MKTSKSSKGTESVKPSIAILKRLPWDPHNNGSVSNDPYSKRQCLRETYLKTISAVGCFIFQKDRALDLPVILSTKLPVDRKPTCQISGQERRYLKRK